MNKKALKDGLINQLNFTIDKFIEDNNKLAQLDENYFKKSLIENDIKIREIAFKMLNEIIEIIEK